jgi:lipoic acid synthetase
MESANKSGPYPGGLGPFTGRDPNVKKPAWLRQKAPQGERFSQIKESISQLKLNTVCEEAQCPNIGEVLFLLLFFLNFSVLYFFLLNFWFFMKWV